MIIKVSQLLALHPTMDCSEFMQVIFKPMLECLPEDDYRRYEYESPADDSYTLDLEENLYLFKGIPEGFKLEFDLRLVHQEGGEGQGDHYEEVYEFKYKDGSSELIALYGFYSSHGGVNYECGEPAVVQPVQKTITVYEPINKKERS